MSVGCAFITAYQLLSETALFFTRKIQAYLIVRKQRISDYAIVEHLSKERSTIQQSHKCSVLITLQLDVRFINKNIRRWII